MEIEVRKPDCYWTYEKCAEIALICIRRNELRKNFNGAYDAALRNNWLDKICEHMEKPYESNKRWTFDKCQELALNCKNKIEFKIKYTNASHAAQRNGWMNKICMHMEEGKKPNGYWTKDKCQEKALTCKTRHEFEKKYGSAYISSLQNKWIDDICVHMKPQGNHYNRLIYGVFFENKSVYIGLSYNPEIRFNEHLRDNKSCVYQHIEKTKLKANFIILSDFMSKDLIGQEEEKYKNIYKNLGYTILNKAKCGSLGGNNAIWNKEKCRSASLECIGRTEFSRKFSGAYHVAIKNNWLNEFFK